MTERERSTLSPELADYLRRLRITTSRSVTSLFAGQYRSAFRGLGMEFGEVREYEHGDDVRFIDWNVTARTSRLHVKQFFEERQLNILFLLDVSPSFRTAATGRPKIRAAVEIMAVLAAAGLRNRDRIGSILFTDRIEQVTLPAAGQRHVTRILRDALALQPTGAGTDLSLALDYARRILKRRTVVFILSDFYSDDFRMQLSVINRHHDMIAVRLIDRLERELPGIGIIAVRDAETGEERLLDSSSPAVRKRYSANAQTLLDVQRTIISSAKVDALEVDSATSPVPALVKFFRLREKRLYRPKTP